MKNSTLAGLLVAGSYALSGGTYGQENDTPKVYEKDSIEAKTKVPTVENPAFYIRDKGKIVEMRMYLPSKDNKNFYHSAEIREIEGSPYALLNDLTSKDLEGEVSKMTTVYTEFKEVIRDIDLARKEKKLKKNKPILEAMVHAGTKLSTQRFLQNMQAFSAFTQKVKDSPKKKARSNLSPRKK